MTKTKLNWRLQDLPTAGEVAELVNSEVITKDEAREILFSEKDKTQIDNEQIKAYKEQIEFLQGLVTKLSANNMNRFIGYTYTFTTPKAYWNEVWCSTNKMVNSTTSNIMSASGTKNLTCSL